MSDIESPDDEISWMALQSGERVIASDGKQIGHVTHILGDLQEDVFDGIGFKHGLFGQRMLPRKDIARITRGAVYLSIPASAVDQAAATYSEERIYDASERGKKLRWSKEKDDEYY